MQDEVKRLVILCTCYDEKDFRSDHVMILSGTGQLKSDLFRPFGPDQVETDGRLQVTILKVNPYDHHYFVLAK